MAAGMEALPKGEQLADHPARGLVPREGQELAEVVKIDKKMGSRPRDLQAAGGPGQIHRAGDVKPLPGINLPHRAFECGACR